MSNLGLGGLVSGVNTDDILYKLMQIENARIDLEKAKKTDLAAKQDAWHKVKSSLETLRLKLDGVRQANSLRTREATLTDDSVASVTASSGATVTTHKLSVTQLAQAEVVGGNLEASATTALGYSGSVVINGKTITVGATDSLNSLRDQINATPDVSVKAEVVKVTSGTTDQYRLILTAKSSGAAGMTLANVGGADLLHTMGLDTDADPATTPVVKNTLTAAQNAIFTLDNQAYETTSNTISDAVPGLTITLKKADPAGAATDIAIGQSTDAAANAVQAWVDALNSTADLLKSMTKYNSATKEKGVLNGDNLARNIMNSLRSILSSDVAGLPDGANNLSDVGITTGAWGTENYGKIVLDKSKLTAKLTADEDAVARVFGGLRVDNNLALAVGTTAGASSSFDPATTGPALVINGNTADAGWQSLNVPSSSVPETLTITLPSAQSVDQVKLYTPDGAAVPTAGLKDFRLLYLDSTGGWKELQSVTNFTGTSRTLSFDPVVTTSVKLEITSTYNSTAAKVSELQLMEANQGAAVRMYRYANGTLASGTGPVATRDSTFSDQIKTLDDKISKMYQKMAERQDRLKQQFNRMEQALSRLQAQGNQLMGMLGYANQK